MNEKQARRQAAAALDKNVMIQAHKEEQLFHSLYADQEMDAELENIVRTVEGRGKLSSSDNKAIAGQKAELT